ncbi:hypothetical protein FBEOM_8747 [Fusarium beomiforme]|uniref:YMC020W-like alpha/beta hydrolase domain-containing protein n=1 Tax=Fusarium beomiforme TaxID=44412 RepID=A0A9P5DWY7_9HYPO|nr:hypothetical protein FBEOM_8747 [Fusarium beomiforme]
MLPRKKVRPNPAETAANNDSQTLVSNSTTEVPTSQSQASKASPAVEADHNNNSKAPAQQQIMSDQDSTKQTSKEVRKTKSWYGSWQRPSKASASTSVAKENIFGGSVRLNKTSDLSRYEARKSDDSASIRSSAGTIKTMPKVSETKSDVTMTEERAQTESQTQKKSSAEPSCGSSEVLKTQETSKGTEPAKAISPKAPESKIGETQPHTDSRNGAPLPQPEPQGPATSSGWLGWWSKTPFTETQTASAPDRDATSTAEVEATKEVDETRPVTPPAQTASSDQIATPKSTKESQPASWFRYWYPATEAAKSSEDKQDTQPQPQRTDTASKDVTITDVLPPHQHEPPPKAGSTWVFWSKESPRSKDSTPMPESGEVAVMGEGSEAHPRPMAECDVSPTKDHAKGDTKTKDAQAAVKSGWMKKNKRARPQSMDLDPPSPSVSGTSTPTSTAPATQDIDKAAAVKAASSSPSISESEISKTSTNLLLPSFSSTYHMKENPSIIKQLTQFLLRTQQAPPNHVFRVDNPPKIRKAIAIGVHGLFPATYLRPMIGQPTGTSLRFAALGAEAIRRWTESHGCGDCEIERVALEGEGKIRDRVDNLWNLMLNWIDHIRSADFILIACHSQGVPVSIMLLEKLIDLGIITNAKVGVCAMAGVALGPFPDYKSGLLMGSAAELWEFGNPESDNSKRFEKALKRVVDYGTRVTFIGSIDDQVVPMESAIYSPANHPYIYRAVFIDGRVHAPDFIAHLVGFALKLRNLGVSDHGLIRELSVPLAGSLYSGAGHSRLYYDDAVYDLAIAHALETAPAGPSPSCTISQRGGPLTSQNPYVLPWIMRGLLEETFVRTELSTEADELLRQFDDWKPTNKALKDVKYRLEAVRSKL